MGQLRETIHLSSAQLALSLIALTWPVACGGASESRDEPLGNVSLAVEAWVDVMGDLDPEANRDYFAELESTALPPEIAERTCGTPAGVSQVFVSVGNDGMTTAPSDQLGQGLVKYQLPQSPSQIGCGYPVQLHPMYESLTDHNLARLPDGRLININLFVKMTNVGGEGCEIVPETRGFYVRVSSDCGAHWDLDEVLTTEIDMGPSEPRYPFMDRQTLYVDSEQNMIYLSARFSETLDGFGNHRTVVLRARGDFEGPTPTWETVTWLNELATVQAMAAAPDGYQRLWVLRCLGGRARLLSIEDPVSASPNNATTRIVADYTEAPSCEIVPSPLGEMNLFNAVPQLGLQPIEYEGFPSGHSQLRIVYPGTVVTGGVRYQTAHVWDYALDHSWPDQIIPEAIASLEIDKSAEDFHVLWPDLVAPEGFELLSQYRNHQVLSYVALRHNDTVEIDHEVYSRTWRNPEENWSEEVVLYISSIEEAKVRPLGEYRWFGDYKFGTFIADSASEWRPRYFVPWSQTKYGAPGYSAQLYGAVWTL